MQTYTSVTIEVNTQLCLLNLCVNFNSYKDGSSEGCASFHLLPHTNFFKAVIASYHPLLQADGNLLVKRSAPFVKLLDL